MYINCSGAAVRVAQYVWHVAESIRLPYPIDPAHFTRAFAGVRCMHLGHVGRAKQKYYTVHLLRALGLR